VIGVPVGGGEVDGRPGSLVPEVTVVKNVLVLSEELGGVTVSMVVGGSSVLLFGGGWVVDSLEVGSGSEDGDGDGVGVGVGVGDGVGVVGSEEGVEDGEVVDGEVVGLGVVSVGPGSVGEVVGSVAGSDVGSGPLLVFVDIVELLRAGTESCLFSLD
jgi:hypothetical protein